MGYFSFCLELFKELEDGLGDLGDGIGQTKVGQADQNNAMGLEILDLASDAGKGTSDDADLAAWFGIGLIDLEGDAQTIDVFTTRANIVEGSSRCLGWDSPEQPSSGGLHVSPCSFGHTGFTGTSFWMDPEKGVAVALLTNAVHPKRECKGNGYFPWRNRMHTYAYEVLGVK